MLFYSLQLSQRGHMGKTKCQLCLCITHQGFRFLRPTPLPSVSPPSFLSHPLLPSVCLCLLVWLLQRETHLHVLISSTPARSAQSLHYSSARLFHPVWWLCPCSAIQFSCSQLLCVYVLLLQCFCLMLIFSLLHAQNPHCLSTQLAAPPNHPWFPPHRFQTTKPAYLLSSLSMSPFVVVNEYLWTVLLPPASALWVEQNSALLLHSVLMVKWSFASKSN